MTKQIDDFEKTTVFFSLIADEVAMGGLINWRTPEDILAQGILRLISGPDARVEASLIAFTKWIEDELKSTYERDTLCALVSYAADELLRDLEIDQYYTELAERLINRFCKE